MISCTPFGQTGPYADWRGYELNAYHLSATGSRYCGLPDREPLATGEFLADFFGGFAAAAWGLGAVLGRGQVGGGQHVDCASAEVLAALVVGSLNVGGYAQDGVFYRRTGRGMGLACPARIYPCRDGWVFIIALETHQWLGLCRAMGNPDWAMPELFHELEVPRRQPRPDRPHDRTVDVAAIEERDHGHLSGPWMPRDRPLRHGGSRAAAASARA